MTQPDKLTIEDIEKTIYRWETNQHGFFDHGFKISPYYLLRDIMREKERLRKALEMVLSVVGACHDCWNLDASAEDKSLIEQALSNKDSDHGN